MAITGNEWKRLLETAQQVYVIGVVDTWNNLAQIIEATEKPSRSEVLGFFTDVTRCLRKRITYGQITAIVQKYMENNPSQWHYDMASLTWNAVNEAYAPASK